jgi:hypothetical protein
LRAAAFGKAAVAPEVRIACEQLGIQFDAIGTAAGRVSTAPEQELVQYDLVFASARSALEALCCGCAVIVCDVRGFSGLVTSHNFESLRAMNFGLRCLTEPLAVDRCVQGIGRYDPDDASRVANRARADADLNKLLDKFEQLYDDVLTGARRPSVTAEAREHAIARFLHENLPRRPGDTRWPWLAEREGLQQNIETLTHKIGALTGRLDDLQRQLAATVRERDETTIGLRERIDALHRQLAAAECERDELRDSALAQQAHMKRSRLLKIGRLLRRIAGLPMPY